MLQRSLAINAKVTGPDSLATAMSQGCLANLYLSEGAYGQAKTNYEQALAICEKKLDPDDTHIATALICLANADISLGDFAGAEPLLQRGLAIQLKVLGAGHPDTGRSLQTLAALYYRMGDFARAESFYQRALAVFEKNPGPEHPTTAATLSGLGLLYMDMGDYDKAIPLVQRAIAINEKTLGPNHPGLAVNLAKLAGLYEKTGNFVQADELAHRALKIDETALGPESAQTAIDCVNLGGLYTDMGMLSEAESYAKRAMAIQEKVFGPENPTLAVTLNNLASIYSKMGKFTEAEPLKQRAMAIDEKTLGYNHPNTAGCLADLATIEFDLQKTNEALRYADQAEQARLNMLDNILSFTSEQQRLDYEVKTDPFVMFASLGDAPRMAQAILRRKGVVLDSLLEDQLVAQASTNLDDRTLIEQLGPAKRQLAQLLMSVPKDSKPETLKNRVEMWEKLSGQVEQLQGRLAQQVAGVGHARRALTVTVDQVQKAIPPKAVLLEFIQYDHYLGNQTWEKRYGAIVLAANGAPQWAGLGAATNIAKNVLLCQQAIRLGKLSGEETLSTALHQLYQQVWEPLEAFFPPHTETVIISPDASLNFVSFATLLTPHNQFLAEKYSVRYVASGRDLLGERAKPTNQDMILFAAPDYTAGGAADRPQTGLQLAPLPYFETNAAALSARARAWGWPVKVYAKADATEAQVRSIHAPHILHFATHGFFLPDTIQGPDPVSFLGFSFDSTHTRTEVRLKNPMYRSGVALAGAQTTLDAWQRGEIPPTETDGILTAEEAGSLDLHGTWLVVLSACDTGVGEFRLGEGVPGLAPDGFVQAGAQNPLMTLWPVYDIASGELMLNFYAKLHENNNPPAALAEVQRDALVKFRAKSGLMPAVIMAGAFIVSSQGPVQ